MERSRHVDKHGDRHGDGHGDRHGDGHGDRHGDFGCVRLSPPGIVDSTDR